LQLRIFQKGRVTEDFTLGEVPVLPKNARSQLPKVPLQGFYSTPTRFRHCFLQLMGNLNAQQLLNCKLYFIKILHSQHFFVNGNSMIEFIVWKLPIKSSGRRGGG
jgi:hypothetical protein